jgi:hypothetical protein
MTAENCSCITCGDQATEMRVTAFDPTSGLARCVDPDGNESEVDALLVDDVAEGTRLMVHAGTAIAVAP